MLNLLEKVTEKLNKKRWRSFEKKDCYHESFQITKLPKSWDIEQRLQQKPYHSAILKLREIDICEGPMMKVRLLDKVNNMIKVEISNHWKGIPIDESHLIITQDLKIPLYIYLVIKCKLVNLAAHIKFIQEFTTDYVRESNLGSNLALYESAMTIVADKKRNILMNVIDTSDMFRSAIIKRGSFVSSVFDDDLDPFVEFTADEIMINDSR